METDVGTKPRESAGRRTIKNLRWWILGFAMLAGIINYMDRSAFSIAAPELIRVFNLTATIIAAMADVAYPMLVRKPIVSKADVRAAV